MCSTTELTARRRKMRIQYSLAPGLASISMRQFDATPPCCREMGMFPPPVCSRIAKCGIHTTWEQISFRTHDTPFLAVATLIFLLAILHTFLAVPSTRLAHRVQEAHDKKIPYEASAAHALPEDVKMVSFKAAILILAPPGIVLSCLCYRLFPPSSWRRASCVRPTRHAMSERTSRPAFRCACRKPETGKPASTWSSDHF